MQKILLLCSILCAFELTAGSFSESDTSNINRLLREAADCQRTNQQQSLKLSENALQLSAKQGYTKGIAGAQVNIGSILYTNGAIDTAKGLILHALRMYEGIHDDHGASGAELLLSYIYQDLGMTDSAFASLYQALKHNSKAKNAERLIQIHINLGNLHLSYGDKKQALENFAIAQNMATANGNIDGSISAWDGLGRYHLEVSGYNRALGYFRRVDSVSRKTGDIYTVAQNLNNIALCYEYLKDYGRAKATYEQARQHYEQLKMTGNVALAYYNIGNIFLTTRQTDSAIQYLQLAVKSGRMANDPVRVAKSYKLLSRAYAALGDYSTAYRYEAAQSALNDSILNAEKVKQIAAMQTRYDTEKKRQRIALLEAQNKTRSAQRNIFIVGTVLLFLLAGAIGIGWVRTRKQKAVSESLLLNILPAEVAEELKDKGSADAQYFDQVTVLFTDFKDFTQITEKMSPAELVNLLHECFKAFDFIITKHRVEKIKTIGDSYMCAGGLPVPNKSYPEDVVMAALEIQAYMSRLKASRIKEGKEPIEMRVGIHTGPVVAGIVGVKKFAYDIWGDTVNTASRMESSGEEGKVNISATTYELIKDKFDCTPRGKINAKHKGELDMYFVEQAKSPAASPA